MVRFDFFDYASVLSGLENLYGIEENRILKLIVEAQCEENPVAEFIKKASIELDSVDISRVMLHCKHIMTIDDDFASIKKHGLLTLDKVLTYDTPLHDFLLEHGIEVDVDKRNVYYKEKEIHLFELSEECAECFYGGDCKHTTYFDGQPVSLTYKNMACDFREGISTFETKLYTHKSEIEVHLAGELKEVHNYSEVKFYPEILVTLEDMIWVLFKENPHLKDDWRKRQAGEYYCLDFDVNILDFEAITSKPILEGYEDYYSFNKIPIYDLREASSNFYGNVFILTRAIQVLSAESPTVYGALCRDVRIGYEDIKISKFHVK